MITSTPQWNRGQAFVGRKRELAEVWNLLRNHPQDLLVKVIAPRGGGKTAFLHEIATRASMDGRIQPHLIDFNDDLDEPKRVLWPFMNRERRSEKPGLLLLLDNADKASEETLLR